jgi:hypothetical protein
MNKTIVAITLAAVLAGCTGTKSMDSKEQAYRAGALTAAIYLDTQNVQSSEINQAARVAYYALVRVTAGESESLLENIIAEELEKLDSAVGKMLVMQYFETAKGQLESRVGSKIDLPLLVEFRKGVDSVIK